MSAPLQPAQPAKRAALAEVPNAAVAARSQATVAAGGPPLSGSAGAMPSVAVAARRQLAPAAAWQSGSQEPIPEASAASASEEDMTTLLQVIAHSSQNLSMVVRYYK